MKVYKNGIQSTDTTNKTDAIATNTRDLDIGGAIDGSTSVPFNGTIDEVRIYDRALSENEINRIYNRTQPDELTGEDLKTGTWTSQIWDSGAPSEQSVDNLEYSMSTGTGENVLANIGVDEDDDGSMEIY